jgi:hypothetical protein
VCFFGGGGGCGGVRTYLDFGVELLGYWCCWWKVDVDKVLEMWIVCGKV